MVASLGYGVCLCVRARACVLCVVRVRVRVCVSRTLVCVWVVKEIAMQVFFFCIILNPFFVPSMND